jgi:hypothetical protein
MGWSYDDVMALPHDVYIEAIAYVNDEVQKPR